jgi:hypothetical protein
MDSPILIDNGYIEENKGSMRESYSVHCDESFTPSPGKPFIAGSSADFKRNGQDLAECGLWIRFRRGWMRFRRGDEI